MRGMPSHPNVHLGIQSPRADKLVRLDLVKVDAGDDSLVIKIVPCDSNGRTRPDNHPSPEMVTLTEDEDMRAFHAVANSMQVCWLRCHSND
jgi:hypothetical protein